MGFSPNPRSAKETFQNCLRKINPFTTEERHCITFLSGPSPFPVPFFNEGTCSYVCKEKGRRSFNMTNAQCRQCCTETRRVKCQEKMRAKTTVVHRRVPFGFNPVTQQDTTAGGPYYNTDASCTPPNCIHRCLFDPGMGQGWVGYANDGGSVLGCIEADLLIRLKDQIGSVCSIRQNLQV